MYNNMLHLTMIEIEVKNKGRYFFLIEVIDLIVQEKNASKQFVLASVLYDEYIRT